MPREAKQSNNWNYEVSQVKLMTPEGNFSGFYGNMRKDNSIVLGVTSEQYGIVQNSELMQVATNAFDTLGMKDYEQKIVVAGEGERVYVDFTFKNRALATSVGDFFGYTLRLQNSFDRTLRAAISLELLRLACLNGMATTEKEFAMTAKHSMRISTEFVKKAIGNAVERAPQALDIYTRLIDTGIKPEEGQNILAHFEEKNILSGKVKENIETRWLNPTRKEDQDRNLYNLYNAATEYLTHEVSKDRFEYAKKVGNNILLSLINAAKKPEVLKKLIVPIPSDKVTISASGPIIDVEVVQP